MEDHLFDLTHKVAIVTGGAQGIGKTIAQGLAQSGSKIVIGDIKLSEAEKTAQIIQDRGGQAIAIQTDVTNRQDCANLINQTVAHYNQLDIMVCNAGINIVKPALSLLEAEWDAIIDVDLKGYFNCAQLAAQQMIQQGTGGSIIMNSSIASVVGFPYAVAYSAAKGGVNQLVRTLAIEWATHGIRVNAIAPGYIDNTIEGLENPTPLEEIKTFVPMNRKGKLEELIGPVVFLASEAASYVTGAILMVDGGYSAM
ncbi:Glucose 1-dehydrogenase 2 [Planktothrix tepida]|uniref:Glucose 1-dehydrogenase 2 n=2 Tax=Planktothrix TaxID=54304 RepID=A0A9W4CPG8_9CYAN|nr:MULTISPECIES: SDR family NAD(P)-dependent oxidoreductase [Planktothrix]CAD5944313.1 Glucose 1-dehydrogenase 2 [Planktothrix pseudagardhii]CAD5966502.1 Glucose 1-dehydrogenase 2 [Planktothrix tepida]CUR35074.1 putative dehydrogenase [Planktothrix tepida PCC 9214]